LLKVDEKYGKEKEAHEASLFVPTYDLTYHRPVAFVANRRLFRTARFFGVDPLAGHSRKVDIRFFVLVNGTSLPVGLRTFSVTALI
jgi:hypothetical protein